MRERVTDARHIRKFERKLFNDKYTERVNNDYANEFATERN